MVCPITTKIFESIYTVYWRSFHASRRPVRGGGHLDKAATVTACSSVSQRLLVCITRSFLHAEFMIQHDYFVRYTNGGCKGFKTREIETIIVCNKDGDVSTFVCILFWFRQTCWEPS